MADLTTLTLDVETTMASSHKNKAHFADPENRLVLMGMKYTAKNEIGRAHV